MSLPYIFARSCEFIAFQNKKLLKKHKKTFGNRRDCQSVASAQTYKLHSRVSLLASEHVHFTRVKNLFPGSAGVDEAALHPSSRQLQSPELHLQVRVPGISSTVFSHIRKKLLDRGGKSVLWTWRFWSRPLEGQLYLHSSKVVSYIHKIIQRISWKFCWHTKCTCFFLRPSQHCPESWDMQWNTESLQCF